MLQIHRVGIVKVWRFSNSIDNLCTDCYAESREVEISYAGRGPGRLEGFLSMIGHSWSKRRACGRGMACGSLGRLKRTEAGCTREEV